MTDERPVHERLSHHELAKFSGSDHVYLYRIAGNMPVLTCRESPFGPLAVTYTEGVKYVRDNGAGWLVDAIASHLSKAAKHKEAAVKHYWFLTPDGDGGAVLACYINRRKQGDPIITQNIPFTDFPFNGGNQPFLIIGGATTVGNDKGEPMNVMHLWLPSED